MVTCRRLARKQREAEWAAFNATRPDEGHEDQADLLAIRHAETSLGDFKLKSDPNYVAPEVLLHTLSCTGGGRAGSAGRQGKIFSFPWHRDASYNVWLATSATVSTEIVGPRLLC